MKTLFFNNSLNVHQGNVSKERETHTSDPYIPESNLTDRNAIEILKKRVYSRRCVQIV